MDKEIVRTIRIEVRYSLLSWEIMSRESDTGSSDSRATKGTT